MQRQTTKVYGVLIGLLAIGGFFIKDGHLLGLMNADTALDWLRVVLALLLLYIGFKPGSASAIRGILVFTGVLYVGMALLGLIDSKLWGLLPNGLTGFDIVFHLITGVAALAIGLKKATDREAVTE
jgi:hypothetical protein